MLCIHDHGAVPGDLGPLIAAVRAIPQAAWVYRSDRESDHTCVVREGDAAFPMALVKAAIEAATLAHLPPGYCNRLVLSCVPAGADILEHRDDFGAAVRSKSFHCHIPLITDARAVIGFPEFTIEMQLAIGRLYSIDETALHYVKNPSGVDRVHLLFAHFPHDGSGRASFQGA